MNEHHIWCNSQRGPVKGCRYCDPDGDGKDGLWAKYPYGDARTGGELMARYFPQNIVRTGGDTPLPTGDRSE